MTNIAQKIVPHLWYDTGAQEAAVRYASLFPDTSVDSVIMLPGTPSGDTEWVSFTVWGYQFEAISAGPYFKLNPSISFMVNFDPLRFEGADDPAAAARARLDRVWEALSEGGVARMPIDSYPFSPRYGWIEDRYGVSWQLMLTDPAGASRRPITPSMLFVGDQAGRAEEAVQFYLDVFPDGEMGSLARYGPEQGPEQEGTVMFSDFRLFDGWFVAMDSALEHEFQFNEAVSFMVKCADQDEIDDYWQRLSAVPEAEQCGWLKDKFGVSWQIVPAALDEMLRTGTPAQVARVTEAFLPMKKLELAPLRKAYEEA